MDVETKTHLSKILAHQLEGIMLHFDLMAMYKVMGMDKMSCIHFKQMKEESACHAKTVLMIIDKYGEIVAPAARSRIAVKQTVTRPENVKNYHYDYLCSWKQWEKSTVDIYKEATEAMPGCKRWAVLKRKAEHELQYVNRLLLCLS